ncbi:MAG TPA: PspC domain-containing protein [Chitinophagaceae bacterium]|nr:PspC domain-containing protein [Chitinophagaceae bacterium]
MKKIISINLSGRVIPIEDSAYEKLQAYIESLRRYFAREEGRDEIINDIESRIAELMNEKVRKGASCVTDADVDEIIASMGRPEDFEAEEKDEPQSAKQGQQQYTYTERKEKRRLYRDTSDKFIGGVCSGIAAYLNTDPAIIRILFAIITFGGFGLGFLIYILLWIVLPTKDLEGYAGKRLYRNPDDRVIGGVAGGLAAYFNRDAKLIRLIMAAPILLSILIGLVGGYHWDYDIFPNIVFSSLTGTFVFVYIILWMVLPEASSPYEKMEMRGEKVDVNTIRQNVKEGMGNMKDRMKGWSEEVKESAQQFGTKAKEFANTRGKTFSKEFAETAKRSGTGLGHAIGVLFKVFFLFIAGTIAFALFVALMALVFGGFAWWPVNNFLWTSNIQQVYAWGTVIFFLVVPLIGFIIWLIRRITGVRSRSSYLGWTFGTLWALGWVAAVCLAASMTRDFRQEEHADVPLSFEQPAGGRLIVAVSEPELEYTGSFGWMNDDGHGWDLTEDTVRLSTVRFNIVKSNDTFFHVTAKKYSHGRTSEDAMHRAEKINYNLHVADSVLDLGSGYSIDKGSKFRGQQVEIEIQVPVGKRLRFDESVNDKLNPTSFRIRRSYRRSHNGIVDFRVDENAYMNRFNSSVDYVMGIDGVLKDPTGNTVIHDDYRYEDQPDSIEVRMQLEEERRKKEASEKRIEELEKKQKHRDSARDEESVDEDGDAEAFTGTPSAGFSLVKLF